MGSYVPGYLEGTPYHNDNAVLTFSVASGNTVTAGQLVTISGSSSGFANIAPLATTGYILGIALTSGILYQTISVILRGEVDVIADGAVTIGHALEGSSTAGQAHDSGSAPAATTTPRLVALTAATTQGQTVRALLS